VTTAGPIIIGVLTHTPPYVWAIFAFIIFMGFQRTRDRTVHRYRPQAEARPIGLEFLE